MGERGVRQILCTCIVTASFEIHPRRRWFGRVDRFQQAQRRRVIAVVKGGRERSIATSKTVRIIVIAWRRVGMIAVSLAPGERYATHFIITISNTSGRFFFYSGDFGWDFLRTHGYSTATATILIGRYGLFRWWSILQTRIRFFLVETELCFAWRLDLGWATKKEG